MNVWQVYLAVSIQVQLYTLNTFVRYIYIYIAIARVLLIFAVIIISTNEITRAK